MVLGIINAECQSEYCYAKPDQLSCVLLNVVMLNAAALTWLSYLHILSTAGRYYLITLLPLSRKHFH